MCSPDAYTVAIKIPQTMANLRANTAVRKRANNCVLSPTSAKATAKNEAIKASKLNS